MIAPARSFERYGGLHPVTFGHCGYPGLCVREILLPGVPVPRTQSEYIDRVDFLFQGYLTAADEHEPLHAGSHRR
jgi:hypothetical protein